jgi:sugar-specific transcriptional regulator TrmB
MDRDALERALQSLGLSQYQVEAYTTTLRLGSAAAVDVARECEVPRSRIYDVLRKLESMGYVETYEQDSLHVRALDPSEARDELERQAESLTDAAEWIDDLWQDPDVEDHRVTLVRRRDTVDERAEQYVRDATNEVHVATTPDRVAAMGETLEGAVDRDVIVHLSLCPPDDGTPIDPETVALAGRATEARHRTIPAPFVLIVDRERMCFSPRGPGLESSYNLIADNYPLAHVFHRYFRTTLWNRWGIVHSERGERPPVPYINLRRAITDIEPLLADGASVEVTVEGIDTVSRDPITVRGSVVETIYSQLDDQGGDPSPIEMARQVSIVVDADDGEYSVGGWYARIEDIEMRRLTVEAVS